MEIHLLVCNAFPESFHEHVVTPAACPVHVDLDVAFFQQARELLAGKRRIDQARRGGYTRGTVRSWGLTDSHICQVQMIEA